MLEVSGIREKIRKLYKGKQIDVNNHRDSYMRIQDFIIENIDGIKLKEGKVFVCPACGRETGTTD